MGEQQPARTGERVITGEAELRAAIAERFLANADSGDDAANDDLVAQLGEWHRKRRSR
jgi:hypothetical protein